jgi:hypothetical protein
MRQAIPYRIAASLALAGLLHALPSGAKAKEAEDSTEVIVPAVVGKAVVRPAGAAEPVPALGSTKMPSVSGTFSQSSTSSTIYLVVTLVNPGPLPRWFFLPSLLSADPYPIILDLGQPRHVYWRGLNGMTDQCFVSWGLRANGYYMAAEPTVRIHTSIRRWPLAPTPAQKAYDFEVLTARAIHFQSPEFASEPPPLSPCCRGLSDVYIGADNYGGGDLPPTKGKPYPDYRYVGNVHVVCDDPITLKIKVFETAEPPRLRENSPRPP